MNRFFSKDLFSASAFAVLSFFVALIVSWVFLAPQNFWYGIWHDKGGIGAAIDKYGPQNRYIRGFSETSRQQRLELFAQINRAIHTGGEGLEEISFETDTYGRQKLLRDPEVIHLRDVANLISFLKYVVLFVLVLWGVLLVSAYRKRALPTLSKQLAGTGMFISVAVLIVLLIGPQRVFETLHVWVFPKENQWFFYYQDSLMSTMMEAPVLFAYIAIALLLWAIVFYCLLQIAVYRLFTYLWQRI